MYSLHGIFVRNIFLSLRLAAFDALKLAKTHHTCAIETFKYDMSAYIFLDSDMCCFCPIWFGLSRYMPTQTTIPTMWAGCAAGVAITVFGAFFSQTGMIPKCYSVHFEAVLSGLTLMRRSFGILAKLMFCAWMLAFPVCVLPPGLLAFSAVSILCCQHSLHALLLFHFLSILYIFVSLSPSLLCLCQSYSSLLPPHFLYHFLFVFYFN